VSRPERVWENIKNHFIRGDLLPYREIFEEPCFAKSQMPRHSLSHNQDQFNTLLSLLDRNDSTSEEVWHLIRML
jgi:hypothetical protein